jgi:spermidine synthase
MPGSAAAAERRETAIVGSRPAEGVLCAVAFLSGCAALVFETLWFRVSGLAFGNGLWATSIVLASFMAGLAAGNLLAGTLAWRIVRPIRFYAALELGIGVAGALLVWGVPGLTPALADLFGSLRDSVWLQVIRFPLAFLLMMVPATAMGATLPILVKAAFRDLPHASGATSPSFGRVLGLLYGWNTLGAVLGAVLGEAWLIGVLGVSGAALAAAGLDAAAAAGALLLARSVESAAPVAPAAIPRPPLGAAAWRLLGTAFLAGGIFLALEVVWFRFLSLFVYGTSLVFAILLAVVLVGLSSGGLLAARWLSRGTRAAPYLPALALLCACATLVCYAGFGPVLDVLLPPETGATAAATPLHVALLSAPLMLPVAILSGVLFTALGDAAREGLVEAARTTGFLTLANTTGAALGSLVGGFVLLPLLGVEASLLLLAGGYGGAALLVWSPAAGVRGRRVVIAAGAVAAVAAAAIAAFPFGSMEQRYLRHPLRPFAAEEPEITAVREGRVQTLVYAHTERFGEPLYVRLFTDGFSMSSSRTESRRYMKAFVYLPAAMHGDLRKALLISYGVGSTAKALTQTPSLETIDVVDISPEILEMSRIVFPGPGDDPLLDPRVRVHVEDGRFFLQTSRERFDLITGEPPPPKYAGVVSLYTREYFDLVRERLADGGMATYWLPVHSLTDEDAAGVIRAFCEVFPDCSLWNGSGLDWILLGTREARRPVTPERFRRPWEDPGRLPELRALGFERPEQLLTTFMAGPRRLSALVDDTPPLEDDHPHRLSSEPVDPLEAVKYPLFRQLLDLRASRRDFAASSAVGALVPPALRAASMPWFRWQQVVNRRLVPGLGPPLDAAALHAVLTRTSLETLPLWMLGSTVEEQRLARSLEPPAAERAEVQKVLGIGDLAKRRYAEAADHLRRARGGVSGPQLARVEILALCLAGELEQASQVARRLAREAPGAAGSDAQWRWLEATFGLPDPRRS